LRQHEALGHQRYLMQMSVGTLPHANSIVHRAIGTKVAPPCERRLEHDPKSGNRFSDKDML